MENTKIGIIREEKTHPDKRVALSPKQCHKLMNQYPGLEIYVQNSKVRSFTDAEYKEQGIPVVEDLSACDILLGVKEVPVDKLIPEKKYLFFSHTIKKQPYNKTLLRTILEKKVQMIDYECLKDKNSNRILGFGRYAGIVGAYNGILGFGIKNKLYTIKPAHLCKDRAEVNLELKKVKLPAIKIAITGGGRVANGAIEILTELNISKVSLVDFMETEFNEPVYCQLNATDYTKRIDNTKGQLGDFYANPQHYESTFVPFTKKADILISAHFWDPASPQLFTKEDMKNQEFKISLIADITCDIAGSVPSTLRSSTIQQPFYDYDVMEEKIVPAFGKDTITIMAVDNLPCELPRDASEDFGQDLSKYVIPALLGNDPEDIIERASITKNGNLTLAFNYLKDYVE
ncbi:MAG: alanine dehydrogenase [Bacteroidetes bacterium]|nr:alanine dehydrogenase [Bacteroidota bacterium]HET6243528.1 NAD(P)-dependent oxidoreductase [Bacteroidia bacterium]